ncbi:hypothetical protein MKY82_22035 [Paenibacillus sp. FSL W7-1279]|uniref:Uncharacterized protein n=1 Tax=Paenibacillus lactis TaxID=228574 RepID=A0ABS4F9Q0_9BACL|nr:hypothetical protein [Paenibacillus lactis]MBP1892984.1 hypothetical protein [Paenibacillus lactis]HAF97545.1 hypothetical protein [Paenibacillus lactis]
MFNLGKKEHVMLGSKRVMIPKLTRNRLKKLTDHIGTIGDYLVKLFLTPENDRAVFIVAAADVTIDEIYELTSLLSDLPLEYLDEHAALGECTEFLRLTWEKNDMNEALKNLNGLIPPIAQQFIQSIVKRMDRADV